MFNDSAAPAEYRREEAATPPEEEAVLVAEEAPVQKRSRAPQPASGQNELPLV